MCLCLRAEIRCAFVDKGGGIQADSYAEKSSSERFSFVYPRMARSRMPLSPTKGVTFKRRTLLGEIFLCLFIGVVSTIPGLNVPK